MRVLPKVSRDRVRHGLLCCSLWYLSVHFTKIDYLGTARGLTLLQANGRRRLFCLMSWNMLAGAKTCELFSTHGFAEVEGVVSCDIYTKRQRLLSRVLFLFPEAIRAIAADFDEVSAGRARAGSELLKAFSIYNFDVIYINTHLFNKASEKILTLGFLHLITGLPASVAAAHFISTSRCCPISFCAFGHRGPSQTHLVQVRSETAQSFHAIYRPAASSPTQHVGWTLDIRDVRSLLIYAIELARSQEPRSGRGLHSCLHRETPRGS